MSAKDPPRFLRLVNAAWPGVSMNNSPGISRGILKSFKTWPALFWIVSFVRVVNDIFCVMPPASVCWIFVPLILSSRVVFPWSTCPTTVTIGCRIFVIYT